MSELAEVLAVGVPPALVPGWAGTNAMCEAEAVEWPPARADRTAAAG